ncbi:GumC family protein [Mesonia aestuariivivens]|uniref:non-specific protein-tyrosine kinase n=1 Tax=Mesonia aestuariivivens TaxID=2796128 RepID=A0ABS6W532_9FLAO|nr:tyrosine-protein kinase family protein [Mesonia aestuariivivens]MBW2962973.1 polysaccharide biosynthesis tyrosine autokinase [Mesonia aestuariivivens]
MKEIMEEQQGLQESHAAEGEHIKYLLLKYLRHWPWFIVSVLACILVALIYIKYTTPVYQTASEVKVLKDDEGGVDLSGLSDATTMFNYSKVNLENEIQIFKSKRLHREVIRRLQLHTSFYKASSFGDELIFGEQLPFLVEWLPVSQPVNDKKNEAQALMFETQGVTDTVVRLLHTESGKQLKLNYGDTIKAFNRAFVLHPNLKKKPVEGEATYKFSYQSEAELLNYLAIEITIQQVGDKSDILRLQINGPNTLKNEAIINTLIEVFNEDGVDDKRLVSKRTQDFVEGRLALLVSELDTVESGLVDFKETNDVVTVESSVQDLFTKEATSEAERFRIETQLAIASDFQDLVQKQTAFELLPANLGIENASINELTASYNELIIERNRLLISSTQENPMVRQLSTKLEQLKRNILTSLNAYLGGLQTSYRRLEQREGRYSGELNRLPQKEKELKTILRQQGIKERLYLFLLQKREEAALSYAVASPSIKVVDYAYTPPKAIAPKKQIILLAGFILGLLIPFGILYVKFLLDTRIGDREMLENYLGDIPIIGEIPLLEDSDYKLITQHDQSILAEAFRIVRTNIMGQLRRNGPEQNQVVFVTSSIKGEGKTFSSLNLAKIFASFSKKVLLVGCDLRNPQLHSYFELDKNIPGLSNYLQDDAAELAPYITQSSSNFENLDILFSGSVPPNPAELLSRNERFSQLIKDAKNHYDYIIVDTAPTIYVTDSLLIADNADLTVYMVKQEHTDKRLIDHIKNLKQKKQFPHISVLFNGVKNSSNYGYGYGYHAEKDYPRWMFWK